MDYFNSLPEEITLEILTRVPTKSVLNCKSVRKSWNNVISHHPSFNKMHLHHLNHPFSDADSGKLCFISSPDFPEWSNDNLSCFEYHNQSTTPIQRIRRFILTPPFDRFNFLGSCNGLICLTSSRVAEPQPVCICNPITKEHFLLPQIKTDYGFCSIIHWSFGFGYVSSTNEYKVVGIYTSKNTWCIEVHIYTLGSGLGWRNLGKFNPEFGFYPWVQAIYANEALYWMNSRLRIIVTFDLAEEKFCEHLSPPALPPNNNCAWDYYSKIGVLDGFLFFSIRLDDEKAGFYDIWLLRKKKDMKEREQHQSFVWNKEFRVDKSKLLAVTKSDGVLTYKDWNLNIYDTKASTSKMLLRLKDSIRKVLPHKNTLVSLKELGEEDSKQWGQ